MKLHPRSSARFSAATESASLCGPQLPPIAHAPKPISETFHPVRPNVRYFIGGEGYCRAERPSTPRRAAAIVAPMLQAATSTFTQILTNAQREARDRNQE